MVSATSNYSYITFNEYILSIHKKQNVKCTVCNHLVGKYLNFYCADYHYLDFFINLANNIKARIIGLSCQTIKQKKYHKNLKVFLGTGFIRKPGNIN